MSKTHPDLSNVPSKVTKRHYLKNLADQGTVQADQVDGTDRRRDTA